MSGRRLTSSWTRSAPRPVSGAACGGRAAGCPDGPLHPTPEKNAMTLIDRLGADLPRAPVTVDLDDIQATVLRYRPEPYYGTHVMLQVQDAQAGRELLRRLTPHIDSAADWWQAGQSWISVAISYRGRTMELARRQYEEFPGIGVLVADDFGAQPGDLNPLGYKDSISQPAIDGTGIDRLPGQGSPIKPGEFILGCPGEAGVRLPMPTPDLLGRNGTYAAVRKYQSRVGTFNRFLRRHAHTLQERELLAAKLVGRWRSGAPLTLAPGQDDPELGADPRRNN